MLDTITNMTKSEKEPEHKSDPKPEQKPDPKQNTKHLMMFDYKSYL